MAAHSPIAAAVACVIAASAANGQGTTCQLEKLDLIPAYHEEAGQSVACSGNRALIGAPGSNNPQAAYLLNGGPRWTLEARLLSDYPVGMDGFGSATCLSRDGALAAVGASRELIQGYIDGSVYLYERGISGDWRRAGKLVAQQPDADEYQHEYFGHSIAMDQNTILVGAYNDPPDGAAYVFDRGETGEWVQSARLVPGDSLAWYFGESVALSGGIAVIGAPNDFEQGQYAGSAYVFERGSDGQWTQTAKLLPAQGHHFQKFGEAVAVGIDEILVGVPGSNAQAELAGAVHVFRKLPGSQWSESARLYAPDASSSDRFGSSLALDGSLLLVGAATFGSQIIPYGAAYVFQRASEGGWRFVEQLMAADPHERSYFGSAVALSGNLAVVGAPLQDEDLFEDSGAAYVFAVGPDSDGNGIMDVCECRAAGDIDMDGFIGLQDLAYLLSGFGLDTAGDLDGDGDTDLQDLAYLLANWGRTCP